MEHFSLENGCKRCSHCINFELLKRQAAVGTCKGLNRYVGRDDVCICGLFADLMVDKLKEKGEI